MKTLKEIKNEIAKEIGYESADNYLSELYEIGSIYTIDRINLFINEIAIRTSKEALKNASENVKMKEGDRRPPLGSFDYIGTHYTVVDRQSILNESNMPKL